MRLPGLGTMPHILSEPHWSPGARQCSRAGPRREATNTLRPGPQSVGAPYRAIDALTAHGQLGRLAPGPPPHCAAGAGRFESPVINWGISQQLANESERAAADRTSTPITSAVHN